MAAEQYPEILSQYEVTACLFKRALAAAPQPEPTLPQTHYALRRAVLLKAQHIALELEIDLRLGRKKQFHQRLTDALDMALSVMEDASRCVKS